jgi:hypothetical protein
MEIFKIKSEYELKRFVNSISYRCIQRLDLFGKIIYGYAVCNTVHFRYIDKTLCIGECFVNRIYPKIYKIKIL